MSIESVVRTGAPVVRKHRWGSPVTVSPSEAFDGNERTERACVQPGCDLVKITVHPARGMPWREWRLRDAATTFALTNTPPCIMKVPA